MSSFHYSLQRRAVVRFFKAGGADSNWLSISLSVLFTETQNSGGAEVPPAPPLTKALQRTCFYSLVFYPNYKNIVYLA